MKTVEEEKENITRILREGLEQGLISEDEYNITLPLTTWEAITPILNKVREYEPCQEVNTQHQSQIRKK